VNPASWIAECDLTEKYFAQFGNELPVEMTNELAGLRSRLADLSS
jgi:phosphoenolpyruvate carboxykinase (GTP)